MTEQQAGAHPVLQVWILTSTSGALQTGVSLIYCDRQVMKSAVRDEEGVTQRRIKRRGEKEVMLCPQQMLKHGSVPPEHKKTTVFGD